MTSNLLKTAVAAALALAGATAASAQPDDLSAFDASRAQTAAERLVLCDTTAFLASRPNLNANRIYARRDGRPFQLMIGPNFVQGGFLYSDRYDRLFWKLRRTDQIAKDEVAKVQDTQGRALVERYRNGGFLPMSFGRAQAKFCDAWSRENGVTGPA
jgi:hypothetical protein